MRRRAARPVPIAFLIPSLAGGGAERATATIADHIDGQRFRATLVIERPISDHYRLTHGLPVTRLRASSSRRALLPLLRVVLRVRPAIIYSALPHLNLMAALVRLLAVPKPRLIVSVHNNQERELADVPRGRLLERLAGFVYRSADAVVVVSGGIAGQLIAQGVPKERIAVIPNPIWIESVRSAALEPVSHKWINHDHELIAAMGRLTEQKDFTTLIRALPKVLSERPRVRLLILGDGELRAKLAEDSRAFGVADAVELLGFDPNPFRYIARSRCFVSSSLWEGFGMGIVEAMACGVPVVATDCPFGPSEILDGGRYGLLVPTADPDAIARAILAMLREGQASAEFSRRGLERAREFDVSNVVPKYEHLFARVTENARGS